MEILAPHVINLLETFLWPMIRVSAFIMTVPFFSQAAIILRVTMLLSLVLTWMIYPLIDIPEIDPFSFGAVLGITHEILVGGLMGITLQIVLAGLIVSGQIIAGGMGLSMANMIDPNVGNVPTLSQFFIIVGFLLFMSFGGHLILISVLQQSFELVPIASGVFGDLMIQNFIVWTSQIFLGAVSIAFPIIFGLLLINSSLGIISRAAPSLNVFAVGFPALIPAGLGMLLLTMPLWFAQVENFWFLAFRRLNQILGG
ncbi:MAG: flagellar biosynthetic protein FliR [Gammaproteobacteria bacterium]|nr:flagellar biosynthetic protein FliR [Gammaproteobacteria bacterium]